jgi:hypothetical protein
VIKPAEDTVISDNAPEGIALTVTLDNSFPLSGLMVCADVLGVADLLCEGVGLTVTLVSSLPLSGVTETADVPAVTVFS